MARYRDDRDDNDDEHPRRRRPRSEEDDERPRSKRRDRDDDDDDDDDDRPRRRRHSEASTSSGGKTALIVFSILGVILLICGGGAFAFYWFTIKPAVDKVKESIDNAQTQTQQGNNAKRIGLSMHNYDFAMATFPHPYAMDPTVARPPKAPSNLSSQLSWRVSVLPYIEQDQLYKKFDQKSTWDSPQNKPLSTTVVPVYSDFDTPMDPSTRWKVFYDNGALFDTNPNNRTTVTSVTDGLSNTIMIVEGGDKGVWSQFNEYKFEPNLPLPQLGRSSPSANNRFTVVLADGSTRPVRQSIDPRILKAAITKAGGEVEASSLFD